MKNPFIIIFVTCPAIDEAEKISKALLGKKLVACANIIRDVRSHFWWSGRIDDANEALLILKSTLTNFGKIEKKIKKLHSYEVPEIVAIPIVSGSRAYLKWLADCVV